MLLFAQLDETNTVKQVIVVSEKDSADINGNHSEEIGIAFCKKLIGADTKWKQTYPNGEYRCHYAGPGYTYNETLDAFIPPKPYGSWVLNETTFDWEAPIPQPELTQEQIDSLLFYRWDEENIQWVLETLPEPIQ